MYLFVLVPSAVVIEFKLFEESGLKLDLILYRILKFKEVINVFKGVSRQKRS